MSQNYDAVLVIAFGGPEGRDDVLPFLENALRGRNVPRERMLAVAEHYYHFDGVSPLNGQVRELIAALRLELDRRGVNLPIFWGNRNWHPLLPDTLRMMTQQHAQRALGLVLSAYSSYSSCRQYRENVEQARDIVREHAPTVDKIRVFYNHPSFIAASADRLRDALTELSAEGRQLCHVAFTAHSVPMSMATTSRYAEQLEETCRLVADEVGLPRERWNLVYQSRSGRPTDPWLEPDICDHVRELHSRGVRHVVIFPVGFLSDHMEVLFDLDIEAKDVAQSLGMQMVRAATVGSHPLFVSMLAELIEERLDPSREKRAIGYFGPSHDVCPVDCCVGPQGPGVRGQGPGGEDAGMRGRGDAGIH